MGASSFIDNSESIDEGKNIHWTKGDACCTTKTSIVINNERVVQLSAHTSTRR
jgi:hypothetical protein